VGDWEETSLGQLCDRERPITYGIVKIGAFVRDGVPVIRGGDIREGRIVFDDDKRVTQDVSDQFARTVLRGGEIVMNLISELGHTAIVPLELAGANVTRDVAVVALGDDVDHEFVNHFLRSPVAVRWLKGRLQGSATQKINLPTLRDLPIPLPPIDEQRRIACILSALDDKIELNRRTNRTLESIARAIFKSWFVDFDPVRRRMEGSEVGLPPDLAAMFPASFRESRLGSMPDEWESGCLGDVSALNPEAWNKGSRPDVLHYVDLSNTKWGRIEAVVVHSGADAPSRAQRVLRCGDTIVGTVRPGNGSYAFVSDDGLTGSTGFAVLRPAEKEYREFVYLATSAPDNIAALALLADGGAYPAVRPEAVAATPVVLPPRDVVAAFSRGVEPLFKRIGRNNRECDRLVTLRDALLPRIVSGQLATHGAEGLAS